MAKQITRSEKEKLEKKLAYLEKEGRDDIAAKLQEARSHGDLSENAEYDEARNDQAKLEEEIAQLKLELDSVEVVDDSTFKRGVVHTGSVVEIEDIAEGDVIKCIIGGSSDDPEIMAISDDSPVGLAVMGHKAGETVDVILPNGTVTQMKIKSTKYDKKK